MHDIWFASKIIVLLKEKIKADKKTQHITVNVKLSPLSHVTEESLLNAFNTLSEKEGFGDVILNIKRGGVRIICKKCNAVLEIAKPATECPKCGWPELEIEDNEEFVVESLEVS